MVDVNWPKTISAWEKSGMSIEAFAKSKGIAGSTMHYQVKKAKYGANPYGTGRKEKRTIAKRKAKSNGHANGFIDLTARPLFENINGQLVLNIPAHATAEQITKVIKILEGDK